MNNGKAAHAKGISSVKEIRKLGDLDQFLIGRYGGYHEVVILPHDIWLRIALEVPQSWREKGNPPRLRCLVGAARYEIIVECAPEYPNRLVKGTLDLTK